MPEISNFYGIAILGAFIPKGGSAKNRTIKMICYGYKRTSYGNKR